MREAVPDDKVTGTRCPGCAYNDTMGKEEGFPGPAASVEECMLMRFDKFPCFCLGLCTSQSSSSSLSNMTVKLPSTSCLLVGFPSVRSIMSRIA